MLQKALEYRRRVFRKWRDYVTISERMRSGLGLDFTKVPRDMVMSGRDTIYLCGHVLSFFCSSRIIRLWSLLGGRGMS
jgi:hypothetical protein